MTRSRSYGGPTEQRTKSSQRAMRPWAISRLRVA